MSTKHTPGPWVAECDPSNNNSEIATIAWVADWCVGIPTPGYPGGNYRDTEYGLAEADARLIAAAPDLLKALRSVIDALESREDVYDGSDGEPRPNEAMSLLSEFGDVARAAIAKATGDAA